MRAVPAVVELIRRRDHPLLSLLADVRCRPLTSLLTSAGSRSVPGGKKAGRGKGEITEISEEDAEGGSGEGGFGFMVEFEFLSGSKQWMADTVLWRKYYFEQGDGGRGEGVDGEGEGAEGCRLVKITSSGVRWEEGMELTMREVEDRRGRVVVKDCAR